MNCADDIASVIGAWDIEPLQWRLNQVTRRFLLGWKNMGLFGVSENWFENSNKTTDFDSSFNTYWHRGNFINELWNYLGLRLDILLNYWELFKHVTERAAKVTIALSWLMANTRGLTSGKQRQLMAVVHTIFLHGSKIWTDVLRKKNVCKLMGIYTEKRSFDNGVLL